MNLAELDQAKLSELDDEQFREIFAQVTLMAQKDRQENAIRYYRPVNEPARAVWESHARVLMIGGGNGSGKTEQMLALITACATGIFPDELRHLAGALFRGPIKVRICCESLTTVLYPVMLPKLQWWKWTGVDQPGGERGHWGWIPPYCLKDRQWEKSWSEKLRILTVVCRDPESPEVVRGESIIQFTSFDQDPSDFASGDYEIVLHDEPPPLAIWRENEARTMRVAGRMLLSMTWPDDPSIPVDWIYDEVYEPGMDPKRKDIQCINLYTTDNPHLERAAVAKQMETWSEEMRRVRIFGQPIRFSNRVHPLFTDNTQHWCFTCGKSMIAEKNAAPATQFDAWRCTACGGTSVCEFNHVREFDVADKWPVIFALDPHPRKPHMANWVMVDPSDDWWIVDEMSVDGDCVDVKRECDRIETMHGLLVTAKIMDPNMGASPSSSKRGVTWQNDFDSAGVVCELADDGEVGRKTINQMLKPDERRLQPRIHIHPRCQHTIAQMKRYSWDEFKRAAEKDQKQTPRPKHDDHPTLLKYIANYNPRFSMLRGAGAVYSRPGRRGAYG